MCSHRQTKLGIITDRYRLFNRQNIGIQTHRQTLTIEDKARYYQDRQRYALSQRELGVLTDTPKAFTQADMGILTYKHKHSHRQKKLIIPTIDRQS
jgi:hypothetical protein